MSSLTVRLGYSFFYLLGDTFQHILLSTKKAVNNHHDYLLLHFPLIYLFKNENRMNSLVQHWITLSAIT
nr:MAG TPA: hypothetical protein [Crassvirales sp.]